MSELQGRDNERGIALIITLAIVAILSVLILEFSYSTWVEMYISSNFYDKTKALYIAKGGIHYAIHILRNDMTMDDNLQEDWAQPMEVSMAELEKEDEEDSEEYEWESYYEEEKDQEEVATTAGH